MIKCVSLFCVCLLVPVISAADTLITWTSDGRITSARGVFGASPPIGLPPRDTPYHLTISFDPAAVTPTRFSSPGSNCFTVPVSGSMTLGGVGFSLIGSGFSNSQLPASTCSDNARTTQFLLGMFPLGANPWLPLSPDATLQASFTEFVDSDGFPLAPASGLHFQIGTGMTNYLLTGQGDLRAAGAPEQPAPVPEPGTMTLVGLGLAAAIRRARKTRRA